MDNNKLFIIGISILIYFFISIFVTKSITAKYRKTAIQKDDLNGYNLILAGIILSIGIIGKEVFSHLDMVIDLISTNKSTTTSLFQQICLHLGTGIFTLLMCYFLSQTLLKFIYEKEKITERFGFNQFGYFILFSILMISLSLLVNIFVLEVLQFFAPKIEGSLYN
ncbi:hypothetical protein J4771_00595 [Candidatus Kaistella beijingensis]|uniref:hypothetical protein n=1 Tax=Candidatus Kaistella beijingensis TaxID=2820270 RepID=UPI001CC7C56D|nr:hypothetical protein [Candidatus Kaistella beijingensis]UBB89883.1 hypothetical protein J4771_00595 [Candidatus Kaistella beijingensis]